MFAELKTALVFSALESQMELSHAGYGTELKSDAIEHMGLTCLHLFSWLSFK